MKVLFILIISLFVTSTAISQDFQFINTNAIRYTVAGLSFRLPPQLEFIKIKVKPQSNKGKNFRLRFFPAKKNIRHLDTLNLVLEGIGGTGKGNISNLIALRLAEKGSNAIVVPSVFTKQFAYSFSKTGYVGSIHDDALDLLDGLILVKEALAQKGYSFTKINLIGYSMGALTAASVGRLSYERMVPSSVNLNKVILINPPVDMLNGIKYIDKAQKNKLIKFKEISKLILSTINIGGVIKDAPLLNPDTFNKILKSLNKLQESTVEKIIAIALTQPLKGVINASQDSFDMKVLPYKHSGGRLRHDIIRSYTYQDYFNKLYIPFQRQYNNKPDLTIEKLNKASSIPALEDYITNAPNIYLMHNEDDFLLRSEFNDIEYLKQLFGNRAFFFKRGGHLGNIWQDDFQDKLWEMIADDL